MELAAAMWRYDDLHSKEPFHDGTFTNWASERSSSHPYRFDDGVRIWVAPEDYGLGGDFIANPFQPQQLPDVSAVDEPPAVEGSPSEEDA